MATSGAVMREICLAHRSGGRYEVMITLMFPFKLEEVVVAAGRAIRVIPAHGRTSFVNGAAALGLVKKHAHGFVHRIFAMTQHAHRVAFVHNLLRKFFAGNLHRNAMMPGQTRNVRWLGLNVVVATAVAGAFAAVVGVFGWHYVDFKLFDTDSKGRPRSGHADLREYSVRPGGVL